jgi:cytochrome c oxidase subunit II
LVKRRRSGGGLVGLAAVLLLAGCGSQANTLDPHSPAAKSIASLWWWLLGGCSFGLAFVTGLLVLAWIRRRSAGPGREPGERAGWIVTLTLGVGVMVVGLVVLFVVADVVVVRDTEAPAAAATKLTVRAVGHQWYWEFDYRNGRVVTAGELHIPARTPVLVRVASADVIHSFWVPELNRKIDAIPGESNAVELYADRAGVYRGECLQYCGLQHAHMDFLVFADPPAKFARWLTAQSRPVRGPTSATAQAGEREFMHGACSSCHTISGTPAHGEVGPDLTHVASRTTLAGVAIPNSPAALAHWITDSQSVKPGNDMPNIDVRGARLRALVAYLETLK